MSPLLWLRSLNSGRALVRRVVEALEESRLIVGALPTGYGKSSIVVRHWSTLRRFGRFIHVLPLRAIVEDVTLKAAGAPDLRCCTAYQAHTRIDGAVKSPFLASLYVVTTYDSFSLNALGVPVAELLKSRWHSDLAVALALGANLILDEVHLVTTTDTSQRAERGSLAKVVAVMADVISKSLSLGNRILILTATLHPQVLGMLVKFGATKVGGRCRAIVYAPEEHPYVASLEGALEGRCIVEPGVDDEFERLFPVDGFRVEVRRLGVDGVVREATQLASTRSRVAVFVNTVSRAVEVYERLEKLIDDRPVLLLHSRMPPDSRRRVVDALKDCDKLVLVATQAVEAGVDVSFDAAISSVAPASSLVQRAGRVCRYGWKPDSECLFVIDEDADGVGSVYDEKSVRRALDLIKNRRELSEGWRWRVPSRGAEPSDYLTLVADRELYADPGDWKEFKSKVEEFRGEIKSASEETAKSPMNVLKYLDRLKSLVRDSPLFTLVFIGRSEAEALVKGALASSFDSVDDLVSRFSVPADLDLLERAWSRNDVYRVDGGKLLFIAFVKRGSLSYLVGVSVVFEDVVRKPFTSMLGAAREARQRAKELLEAEDDEEGERVDVELLGIAADRTRLRVLGSRIRVSSYG